MATLAAQTALERDAVALQEALTALIRVYSFRDRDAIYCYDVSPAQSHALERLAAKGPMTLNALAASLFLEKSSASRLADGLEKKGYILRKQRAGDGRYVLLHLTKPGRTLFEKIDRDLVEERSRILSDLRPSERKVVIRSIAKLADAAASRVDTTRGVCTRS